MKNILILMIFICSTRASFASDSFVTCSKGTTFKKVDASSGWGHTFGYGCDKEMPEGSYAYEGPYVETQIIDGAEVITKKGNYLNGKKVGKWTLDGKKPKKENEWKFRVGFETYSNDELDGPSEYIEYENTHFKSEYLYIQSFKDGKKAGLFLTYYSKNKKQLKERTNYVNDESEGKYTQFYENGKVSEEGTYQNGEKVGVWVEYYENGRKMHSGEYKKSQKNGVWSSWDEHGQIKKLKWQNGNPIWN